MDFHQRLRRQRQPLVQSFRPDSGVGGGGHRLNMPAQQREVAGRFADDDLPEQRIFELLHGGRRHRRVVVVERE